MLYKELSMKAKKIVIRNTSDFFNCSIKEAMFICDNNESSQYKENGTEIYEEWLDDSKPLEKTLETLEDLLDEKWETLKKENETLSKFEESKKTIF